MGTDDVKSDSLTNGQQKSNGNRMTNGALKVKPRRMYKADDTPSTFICILFGFQQVMVCVSALLVIPFLLSDYMCAGSNVNHLRVQLISSTFVASGISTIIQTGFGMRLALLQGTAFAYIPSVKAFTDLPENVCNDGNGTLAIPESEYFGRLQYIQGSLLLSAIVPMLIGCTGLVGMLTKFIGPITVSPLILLLMASSVDMCVARMEKHWVSLIQAATLFITVLYLADLRVPIPGRKNGKFHWYRVNVFGQYPYLIAILVSWGFCAFLSILDLVPANSEARTDKVQNLNAIANSPWFRIPYPGQYGAPKFNASLFFAFLVSALTSVFESVGDYHAIARVSEERSPPSHAINRGILAEGMGSFISGLIGPGVGLTTHTENIGVIGITQVASRATMIVAGCLLIFLGLFTKIGAVLSTIPDPLVGGVLASSMAMVGGVAIANVQSVDLKNSRNVAILGFSLMVGLIVPHYFRTERGHKIDSGWEGLDEVLMVLLNMPMFVGAATACVLDNTVPGATRTQRGLRERGMGHELGPSNRDIYAFPPWAMKLLEKFPALKILPFIPKEKKLSNNRVQDSSASFP
ncbi:unnamed protein product [Bursaphelenchus xylophilus]|uniref:(pine wood nematode) hypothetical protein n=1 Tax=Bursaphelenchus xylophilus TaxID=6326 RepID=A0A1I7RNP0_BURXY|nr:unnamed protein product [Bursaphelenchus xylophilus]CAG9124192.1 unnamed protein product [Bursaphelenchus xylophilus]